MSTFFVFIVISAIYYGAQCNFIQPLIVGGVPGNIDRFKWQAALLYNSKYICGASIISPTKLLTAAHCTYNLKNVLLLQARVGSANPLRGGIIIAMAYMLEHPKFNKDNLNNDVAVLILRKKLQLSSTIGLIELANGNAILPAGTMMTISGFGSTKDGSEKPNVLHYTTVPIVSHELCEQAYKKYSGRGKLNENMICAGFLGVGGKDACSGDSGSALVHVSDSSAIIVGIVSWGKRCGDPKYPGVYAKVSIYREWIDSKK